MAVQRIKYVTFQRALSLILTLTAALHHKIHFIAALTHYMIDFLMQQVNMFPHRAGNDTALFSPPNLFKYTFDKPDLAELTHTLEFNSANSLRLLFSLSPVPPAVNPLLSTRSHFVGGLKTINEFLMRTEQRNVTNVCLERQRVLKYVKLSSNFNHIMSQESLLRTTVNTFHFQ